jgi:hypothetical protein
MRRTWTLTWFLTRDLFHSLAGIVPLAAALVFGVIAFEYGMDQSQFITVAGVGFGAICLLTTLLLASRANRASSYLLLARLHSRTELLASLAAGGLGITIAVAVLVAGANLLAGRLTLVFPSALWILPSWLVLWLLAVSVGLPLSALVGRAGSHLVGYVALATLLVANDQKATLTRRDLDWLVYLVNTVLWPVTTLLEHGSSGSHDRLYFLALVLTMAYALSLFILSTQLFSDKDLLWSE